MYIKLLLLWYLKEAKWDMRNQKAKDFKTLPITKDKLIVLKKKKMKFKQWIVF